MTNFKHLMWLMFSIINCSQPLHAAQCAMRGEWMNAANPALGSTLFEQEDNRIWAEPTPHPSCGQNKLEGTTDGMQVDFKVFTTKPGADCDLVIEYKGSFSSADCSKLEGYRVMHTSDWQSEQIPLAKRYSLQLSRWCASQ